MKTTFLPFITFLTVGISFLSSCGKTGCADVDAENYNSKIKSKNDCCCEYKGSLVFWYNSATSNSLINDGATGLTFYVDGQIVGSSSTSVYFTSQPDCGQNGSITVIKDLGSEKTKTYNYSVVDQTGFEYWAGTVTFSGNTCSAREIAW